VNGWPHDERLGGRNEDPHGARSGRRLSHVHDSRARDRRPDRCADARHVTIHTGAPDKYAWRCYDPCGAGPMGWGTAMAARRGFMEGTLTIA